MASQPSLSRRGSCDSDASSVFPTQLKKGKPVSQVKITFMGKSMVGNLSLRDVCNHVSGTHGSYE